MEKISCSGRCKWYLTAGIIWFIACAVIVIGLPFMELAGRVVFLPILAGGLIRGLYFLLSYKNKRIYISEKEILYFSLFNKQYIYSIDDIKKVNYYLGGRGQVGGLTLKFDTIKIKIPREMIGFLEVEGELKRFGLL